MVQTYGYVGGDVSGEKELYYLTDPETGRRDPEPFLMTRGQATGRNEFMERQACRWRWMTAEQYERARAA